MNWKHFRNTEQFKKADAVDVVDEEGFDFVGTHRQLQNKEVITVKEYPMYGNLKRLVVTIRR